MGAFEELHQDAHNFFDRFDSDHVPPFAYGQDEPIKEMAGRVRILRNSGLVLADRG